MMLAAVEEQRPVFRVVPQVQHLADGPALRSLPMIGSGVCYLLDTPFFFKAPNPNI